MLTGSSNISRGTLNSSDERFLIVVFGCFPN